MESKKIPLNLFEIYLGVKEFFLGRGELGGVGDFWILLVSTPFFHLGKKDGRGKVG